MKQAPIYHKLLDALQSKEYKLIIKEIAHPESEDFGAGEIESIVFAQEFKGLLLMNDQKAAKFAQSLGVTVMDLPLFLFHCKTSNYLTTKELIEIMKELKEKDYYEFSGEVKEVLLE